jgi:hypothetical protein
LQPGEKLRQHILVLAQGGQDLGPALAQACELRLALGNSRLLRLDGLGNCRQLGGDGILHLNRGGDLSREARLIGLAALDLLFQRIELLLFLGVRSRAGQQERQRHEGR